MQLPLYPKVQIECYRPFIFFAEEQKYWYEVLGFYLAANCVRYVDCRKQQHGMERMRRRYEELLHKPDRRVEDNIEMAECSLVLMENALFHHHQTERVRRLLKQIARDGGDAVADLCQEIYQRVLVIECRAKE